MAEILDLLQLGTKFSSELPGSQDNEGNPQVTQLLSSSGKTDIALATGSQRDRPMGGLGCVTAGGSSSE